MGIDSSGIRRLEADLAGAPIRGTRAAVDEVGRIAKSGHRAAQRFARETSGEHGSRYPNAITIERYDALGLAWVYGADKSLPQGDMDFEYGSGRQTRPHLPHNKSADTIAPQLPRVADKMADEVFRG